MNVQTKLARDKSTPATEETGTARRETNLESILHSALTDLGWRRSHDVLLAATPRETGVATLDEAAMVLDLIDVGASVEARVPAAWRSGLDGALLVQDKTGVHALVRKDTRLTASSSANLTHEQVVRRINHAGKMLFVHDPEHSVATVHATTIRTRINKVAVTALFLSLVLNLLALFIPFFSMAIFDRVLGAQASQSLVPLLTGASVVLLAILVLRSTRSRILAAEYARLVATTRLISLSRILRLPQMVRQRLGFDRLQNRLQTTSLSAEVFAAQNTAAIFDAPFVPLSIFAIAFVGGWMAVVPAVYLTLFFALSWILSEARQGLDPQLENANAKRVEALTELSDKAADIQSIDHGSAWFARFASIARRAAFAKHRQAQRSAALQSLAYVLGTGAALTTLCIGIALAMSGTITAGALVGTMLLTWRVTGPSQAFFLAMPRLKAIRKAVSGLEQSISMGAPQAQPAALERLETGAPEISGKGLFFKYDQNADPALTGISFDCAPGSFTIVMGPNGSGKSTFLKMVAGLVSPQSGRLSINGRSVTQYDADDLARSTCLLRLEASDSAMWRSQETHEVVAKSHLILLDDSSGPAATRDRSDLLQVLTALKGKATILFATHDTAFAELADNALILDEGSMAYFGPVTPPGLSPSPSEETSL
ncbi:ATP-binding cassette domain-containing protein [Roseibium sp. FZY0029]|uniref:ATP-binding cassette domain-containing protein n=1 Tax=Roseibium sp. FZY0029 TaxID=3116647 RepID=UPI002EC83DCF|nr:ATP-binding cassette domain-containing protein [Roseibium sp. FZY0029]